MAVNIVFSGIGAMGGYYGARVAFYTQTLKSVATSFFMRKGEHLAMVQEVGLHLTTPSIDIFAHPHKSSSNASDLPCADYLFLGVKGYDVKKNLGQLAPIISKDTIILPMQNGLLVPEQIHEMFPKNTIMPAACHITGRRISPGNISIRSDRNILKIGMATHLCGKITTSTRERMEYIYTLLKASGINCSLSDDVLPVLLDKFIMLSPSATATSYFDMPIGDVFRYHEKELKMLVAELSRLYRAMGGAVSLFLEEDALAAIDKMPKEATTSMHSDILSGHKSEIELLVGYVVKKAKQLKVDVPLYNRYYEELKSRIKAGKEKQEKG